MKFYILYCELEESSKDSFNYFLIKYSSNNNLLQDIQKSVGSFTDIHEFILSLDGEVFIFTQYSYDFIKSILINYENFNFNLYLLSSFLGLPQTCGLYEVFSYYFDSDGVELSDNQMIDAIVTSLLTSNINIQYSYCVCFVDSNKYSFCWFYIDSKSNIIKLGNLELILDSDSNKNFVLGKFMKMLRYKMALSGCCFARTKFLTWNYDSLSDSLCRYIINLDSIKSLLSSVCSINYNDYQSTCYLLSKDLKNKYEFNAREFVNALSYSSKELGIISLLDGSIAIKQQFYKDYSTCLSTEVEKQRSNWGIILDCEGNKDNASGIRELGGIIFYRSNGIMISAESFNCTEILLEETLQQVIRNYEVLIDRYIPSRGIDVYTFGGSDKVMIEESLRSVSNKQFRRKIKKIFRYCDCIPYINGYLESSDLDKRSLSSIAKYLGVQVITPKHNALSDSRTLFNILSFIYRESGYWVFD